jgi:DNA-binding MarR family transcriptional regulator
MTLDEYLHILKAVSSLTRFRILNLLYQHDRPIGQTELVEVLQVKKNNISRHAKILYEAGIIDYWKTTIHVYYTLNKNQKIKSITALLKEYQDNPTLKRDHKNLRKLTKQLSKL